MAKNFNIREESINDNMAAHPRPAPKAKDSRQCSSDSLQTLSHKASDLKLRPASPPKVNPWKTIKSAPKTINGGHVNSAVSPNSITSEIFPRLQDADQQKSIPKDEDEGCRQSTSSVASPPFANRRLSPLQLEDEAVYLNESAELDESSSTDKEVNRVDQSTGESSSVSRKPIKAVHSDTISSDTFPSSTTSSNPDSHQALRSAAERAEEKYSTTKEGPPAYQVTDCPLCSLWYHPIGGNVIVNCEVYTFMAHRDVLERESGYYRHNLPPPNADGSPVRIDVQCESPHAVGQALQFMYTRRWGLGEDAAVLDMEHLPRSVLCYCAAVLFRVPRLMTFCLRVAERVGKDLHECIVNAEIEAHRRVYSIECHLSNALYVMYGQPDQEIMKPMRLVLARAVNRVVLWLLGHPYMTRTFLSQNWTMWLIQLWKDSREEEEAMAVAEKEVHDILNSQRNVNVII